MRQLITGTVHKTSPEAGRNTGSLQNCWQTQSKLCLCESQSVLVETFLHCLPKFKSVLKLRKLLKFINTKNKN